MSFEWIIFSIIILHFIIGFGWLLYKLEIEKSDEIMKQDAETTNSKPE